MKTRQEVLLRNEARQIFFDFWIKPHLADNMFMKLPRKGITQLLVGGGSEYGKNISLTNIDGTRYGWRYFREKRISRLFLELKIVGSLTLLMFVLCLIFRRY